MATKVKAVPAVWIFLIVNVAIVSAQIGVLPKNDFTLKEIKDSKFSVGDVWEYHTRRGEERSRLTIVRIEESTELGIIIHVTVNNVRLSNCHGGPEPDNVQHMPFARMPFNQSITTKVATNQPIATGTDEAYQEWLNAWNGNKAGIYVISVADAVGVAEQTFRRGIGCDKTADGDRGDVVPEGGTVATRDQLKDLIDQLPDDKLEGVRTMLQFQIHPPAPDPRMEKLRERNEQYRKLVEQRARETHKPGTVGGFGGGGAVGIRDGAAYGSQSFSYWDDEALVQTLRYYRDQEIEIMERYSMPAGNRLKCEIEIWSGGRTVRHEEEFPATAQEHAK